MLSDDVHDFFFRTTVGAYFWQKTQLCLFFIFFLVKCSVLKFPENKQSHENLKTEHKYILFGDYITYR